ncbi:hypothetical protein AAE02nite_34390 [Adhaeribacter aerolatus]|uniref:Uncharacterized protein n=1 Tax=Adhaeribacter aerolatus TaxID=670289 RepID=A0A512B1E4_9BACT|nr:bestrophin family ion channel [Adhaeribacter aerolatus]GEO05775.1 hypothetical protein AAE02nite_34390 [Adhaeribacter aerolatus]
MILDKRIPLKYIFNLIKHNLLFVLLISLITNYLARAFSSLLPDMPLSIPAFLGTAISVLLSFKMSQSYDRWWEARKASFYLIEKSAYHLQDPFRNRPSDVSVSAIARTIEINIRQLQGEQEVPETAKPTEFYIL